jgi:predicted DNA-binding transcriptional regulator YafY
MPDIPPLIRQWTILRALAAHDQGVTVREMAERMGVNQKTIRRDLELFRDLGFPLEEVVGGRGKKTWRMASDFSQPPLAFSFDEAVALYLGRRFLEPLAGTLFWEAAQRAFRKIHATLGRQALEYLEQFHLLFHSTAFGAGDYSRKAELIDALMVAIEDRKAVHIAYQSQRSTEPATRDVYPYGLAYHKGSLYLIAFAPEHGEIRHYKVDRMEEVEVSKFPFRRPADFDVREHLARSFGIFRGEGDVIVRVRFLPAVARYVMESKWHPSQVLHRQPDGAVMGTFRLSGTEEIKSWILGFGANAVVLEPEDLRQAIARELRTMLAAYSRVGTAAARS